MEVACIRNNTKENQLTIRKLYTVKEDLDISYAIMDDLGGYSSFPKSWFIQFGNDTVANLFLEYIQAQDEVRKAEEKKSELFKKLMSTGLNTGEIIYMAGRFRGLK